MILNDIKNHIQNVVILECMQMYVLRPRYVQYILDIDKIDHCITIFK